MFLTIVEKIKTRFVFNTFFRKSSRLLNNTENVVEKNMLEKAI